MLKCLTLITITQVTPFNGVTRNKVFTIDFVSEGEINSTWVNLTDTAKLTFPKNIYMKDGNGKPITWTGQSIIADDNSIPILLRGDKINIQIGYQDDNNAPELNEEFDGFITKINPKIPIQVSCEDRMWQLKQVKAANSVFTKDVGDMINTLVKANQLTKDIKVVTGTGQNIQVNVGSFRIQNETIAEVLHRLQKDYRIYSYFRKTNGVYELRIGIVYYPQDRQQVVYHFQKNIHQENQDLEYQRTEDVNVGIKAYSVLNSEVEVINEDATKKTKKKRIEVFVSKNGKSVESGFQGEIVTRYYFPKNGRELAEADLVKLAQQDLRKYYYTGLKGAFSTFCLPKVKHGDEAALRDDVLKEFNGSYLIKGVTTTFGKDGHHRRIQLHLRIDGIFTEQDLTNGF